MSTFAFFSHRVHQNALEHVRVGRMMDSDDSRNCFSDNYSRRQIFIGDSYISSLAVGLRLL